MTDTKTLERITVEGVEWERLSRRVFAAEDAIVIEWSEGSWYASIDSDPPNEVASGPHHTPEEAMAAAAKMMEDSDG